MITELIYDLLILIPTELTCASFLHGYLEPERTKVLWAVISSAASLCLLMMKHLNRRGRAYLLGGMLTLMLAVWVFLPSGRRIEAIREHIWIVKEILLSVIIFFVAMAAVRFIHFRILLALSGIASLIIMLIRGIAVDKIAVCMVLFLTLLTVADLIQRSSGKEGDTEYKKHLAATSVFMVLPFVIIMFITVPDKPYDWHVTRRIAGYIKSEFIMMSEALFTGNAWDEKNPIIGFSDRAVLDGDIRSSSKEVMELNTLSENDPKIYLSGRYYDHFDGRNWIKTDEGTEDLTSLDTLETIGASLNWVDKGHLNDIARDVTLNISYRNMYTTCIFTPAKTTVIKCDDDNITLTGGEHEFSKRRYSRKPYAVNFYRLNRDSEYFADMAAAEHELTPEILDMAKQKLGIGADITIDDYIAYREDIKRYYLEKYDISDEAKALLDELTEDAGSDYEKLQRIEAFLGGFNYNDNPGPLPDDITTPGAFLDHLLFAGQEGYCSYFASAFVILSRQCGIPSRYVQGFAVPAGKQKTVTVNAYRAHAWPESYIEGLGWISFEPTPGMKMPVSWAVSVRQNEKEDIVKVTPTPPHDREYEGEEETETEEKPKFKLKWYQIAIPLLSGGGLTLILVAFDVFLRRRRYDKMSEGEKSIFVCRNCLMLLRRKHMGRSEEETLAEYEDRIGALIPAEYLFFIGRLQELLYSDKDAEYGDRLRLEENYRLLRKYLVNNRKIQNE